MKKKLQLSLLIALTFTAFSCVNNTEENSKESITVSILPQKYFVQSLAGDLFNINVMVAPGASPASYEPTPKQMANLSHSGMYISIGHLGYEQVWIPRIEKSNPDLKIVNLSAGIELLGGDEKEGDEDGEHSHERSHDHGIDPHFWMSPKQARKIVLGTAQALIRFEGACKDVIIQNRDSLLNLIDDLDQQYQLALAPIKNRKFIIFHPALTYLAHDYQLEQIAMEFEGKEPSPAYFASIIDRAINENIGVLFIQKEFDIENAKQMAKEIGAELIQIDLLAEDWYKQMIEILEKLKKLDNRAS